jgi:hypothetical protein
MSIYPIMTLEKTIIYLLKLIPIMSKIPACLAFVIPGFIILYLYEPRFALKFTVLSFMKTLSSFY